MDVSTLPVATNSITAMYSGDIEFRREHFAGRDRARSVKPRSSTTITPSTTTPVFGQEVHAHGDGAGGQPRRRHADRNGPVLQWNDLAGNGDPVQRHRRSLTASTLALGRQFDHRGVFGRYQLHGPDLAGH